MMDLIDARSLITLVSFVAFIGIVIWAYGKRRRDDFDEAAHLPFDDDDMQKRTIAANKANRQSKAGNESGQKVKEKKRV